MPENHKKVIDLYHSGMKIRDIKLITGCGDVYKVLNKYNIKKSRKLSNELKDAIIADYLSGVTTREIIKKYKTYELYSILNEREIEYKQDNNQQKERQKMVVELYLNNIPIDEIVEKTGYKDIYKILKRNGIGRNRDPKKYNKNKKHERNLKVLEDYNNGIDLSTIAKKYNVTKTNIIRILKLYNIDYERKPTDFGCICGTIIQKIKTNPNLKCKFYILEDYYGYTKIGITTKNTIKERFKKKVNIFYVFEDTIQKCYEIEYNLKKKIKKI